MLESESKEVEYENGLNVVIIQVLEEKYLIEVEIVKEIYVPGNNIVPIPLTEKSLVGVINIRGTIYSIISLRHNIFGKDSEYGLSETSRILLLEYKGLKIALLVDAVIGVLDIPISVFKKQGTIVKTNIDFRLIKLTGVYQDETLILLDIDALVDPYIKHDGKKIEKKVDLKPKGLEKPKVQPKITPKPDIDSTIVIPHEASKKSTKKSVKKKSTVKLKEDQIALTDEQQDILKEIGNIGTGNAVTALSRLVKKKIDVTLTDVGIIPLDELPGQFGGPQEKVCGIFCHIDKPSQATILNIFEMQPLMNLIADLAGGKSKINPAKVKTKNDLDDYAISTIIEMGNIMAGHYASALADLLGTKLMIDIPEFTMSNAGEIGEFLSQDLKAIAEFFIIIKTSIKVSDLKLKGMFFFIPDLETLKIFFSKLGIQHRIPIRKETVKKLPEVKNISQVQLTELQRDALQEVGNIGAGNAANALAQMINKRVDINIPSVEMVELDEYASTISKKNEKLLVAWSNVVGKTRATVLTLFNMKDAVDITSIIVDDRDKKQIDLRKKINRASDFPELYKSAISELGHILGSHYVSAIGDLLGLRLMTEPPDMSVDTGEQLFKILKEEIGLLKKLSLVITTSVIITDIRITGTFLFIPNLETLQELLDGLLRFYS
ncbi:MAG: chemotaxis protein CheC [Promethearchaeota archaeon]